MKIIDTPYSEFQTCRKRKTEVELDFAKDVETNIFGTLIWDCPVCDKRNDLELKPCLMEELESLKTFWQGEVKRHKT